MINKIYKKFKIIFTIEKPEKVRIRTSEELEIRKYEFLKICEILDKLKIKCGFLSNMKSYKKLYPKEYVLKRLDHSIVMREFIK